MGRVVARTEDAGFVGEGDGLDSPLILTCDDTARTADPLNGVSVCVWVGDVDGEGELSNSWRFDHLDGGVVRVERH